MKIQTFLFGLAVLLAPSLVPAQSVGDLKFPPLKEIPRPQVEEFTLSNGMKVFLLEDHELPLVRGTALIRTGNLFDPPDKVGLAGITGEVLRSGGTKDKTGDELDTELEDMAASVESGIGETSGSVSFSTLKENTGRVLEIFRDVMTQPAFRQEKLDLELTQDRSAIARRNDSASGIAQREFYATVYGDNTPYGWEMEYKHLDNIHRDDLVNFYQRYFFPRNVMLAVYGDFSTQQMKQQLESVFGGWKVDKPPVPAFPPVTAKPAPGIYLADKPDVNQTFIRIGHLGGELKDPDYPALDVMADILGGGFSSRLFLKVRTELGYAYGIGSAWSASYNHPGTFFISGSTKSQSTAETVEVVLQEVEKIRTNPVTSEELATAKQKVLNSFVFNFATPAQTLFRLLTDTYHGYPRDFIFQYQKAVEKVTAADVLRVAKQHIHPEQFSIVAVGNTKLFDKPIQAFNFPTKEIDLTIPMPGAPEKSEASAESLQEGKEALAQVRMALGGAAVNGVRDFVQEANVKLETPQGPVEMAQAVQWVSPDLLQQSQTTPRGKLTFFFNGETGWVAAPQGVMDLPEQMKGQLSENLFRFNWRLLHADRIPGYQVNLAAPGELEISDKAGRSVRLFFDPATGMPAGKEYATVGQAGPVQAKETFSDWRDVNGVKVPFRIEIEHNGKKYAEVTVAKAEINTGLTSEKISQKP